MVDQVAGDQEVEAVADLAVVVAAADPAVEEAAVEEAANPVVEEVANQAVEEVVILIRIQAILQDKDQMVQNRFTNHNKIKNNQNHNTTVHRTQPQPKR